eukprot:CAMPEP_0173424816 /NCGR_PEP_ID=MMETSP1357-20121228/4668_1 /TAXON_ID=77926 /ORGANISM="Hemiselmis rufescens, Strain PCC563" /LENGTH=158 /DNA_ID=CAMNT_0014388129 /DNA_START=39 /DNA_END=515 /DNA_ORIENTATION=-
MSGCPIAISVFKFYFASHIPATVILDAQFILPASLVPNFFKTSLKFYTDNFKDPLFLNPPLWFKSLMFCETTLQLPFFFVALYALTKRKSWIKTPIICYAIHAATTLVPILTNHLLAPDVPEDKRLPLFFMFLPYLLIPLWMVRHFTGDDPFRDNKRK